MHISAIRLFVALVTVLGAVLFAGVALAAPPKKGGVYEGTLHATSAVALPKKVRIVVDKAGTSARIIWWCGVGRGSNTMRFPVAANGTFSATSNVGTLTVWAVKGRFVSPKLARVALQLKVTCDGKGGTVNLALQP